MKIEVQEDRSFQASPELIEALKEYGSVLNHPPGVVLFERGQKAYGLFLLRTGRAKLSVPGALEVWVGAGSLLGVPGTLSKGIYSLRAELLDEACVLFVPSEHVTKLMSEHPELGFHMVQMLSREVQSLRQRISKMTAS